MNVLFFDIENTPITSYTWGMYDQNVVAVNKDWELLSVAYSHGDEKTIKCIDRRGDKSDKTLTKALWKLLDEADVVIAHNAVEFDVKKANAKFLEHGLTPPSPFIVVDTLKIARSKFKFTSNKLDDLAKLLKVPRKRQHSGIDMWLGCMSDDASSWNRMVKYNKQDIVVLRGVYKKVAPWAKSHPNYSSRTDGGLHCPTCRSPRLERRGFVYKLATTYRRYRCSDCGKWSRARLGRRSLTPRMLVGL